MPNLPLLTHTFFSKHCFTAALRVPRNLNSVIYGTCCQFWENFTLFVMIFKIFKILRFPRKYLSSKLGSKKVRNFMLFCLIPRNQCKKRKNLIQGIIFQRNHRTTNQDRPVIFSQLLLNQTQPN